MLGEIDDDRTTVRIPHRRDDERISVELFASDQPPLRLFFASPAPDAKLVGLEFGSEEELAKLDGRYVAHVAANLTLYEQYARASILWNHGDTTKALKILRNIGAPRRGLPSGHYRIIADEYNNRVDAGERAPITTIANAHGVYKSTASRWIKEAKKRRYIKTTDDEG